MFAGGQVGEGYRSLLLKRGPVASVQPAGVEQPLAGRVVPFVLSAEAEGDGAAFRDVLLLVGEQLDVGLWRVRIGFGVVEPQAVGGAGPDPAALIFAKLPDAPAGQAFFRPVLDPRALEEAMQPAVACRPTGCRRGLPMQGVDAVQPHSHRGPVPAVERPDLVRGGAPDLAVRQFGEADHGLRAAAVGRDERAPFLVVVTGGAVIAAHPEIAVLGGKQRREIGAGRRIRRRHGQRLEFDAIVSFQAKGLFGRCWRPGSGRTIGRPSTSPTA